MGDENAQVNGYNLLKEEFIDKGIPILMGEYGAFRRDTPLDLEKHNAFVDHWIKFVTKEAKTRGIVPFWWDTGGVLDRKNYTVKDQRTIDAIITGGQ